MPQTQKLDRAPGVDPVPPANEDFLAMLEQGVREIVCNRKASKEHKLSAINAGAKLLQIRHKINGADSEGFFDK